MIIDLIITNIIQLHQIVKRAKKVVNIVLLTQRATLIEQISQVGARVKIVQYWTQETYKRIKQSIQEVKILMGNRYL